MRVFRVIGSIVDDIECADWFGIYMATGILLSGLMDLYSLMPLSQAISRKSAMVFFEWVLPIQFVLWGIFLIRNITRHATPYLKEKWEETKTTDDDKSTLLRASKEKR